MVAATGYGIFILLYRQEQIRSTIELDKDLRTDRFRAMVALSGRWYANAGRDRDPNSTTISCRDCDTRGYDGGRNAGLDICSRRAIQRDVSGCAAARFTRPGSERFRGSIFDAKSAEKRSAERIVGRRRRV